MELLALIIDADAHERGVVRNIIQCHNWTVHEAASADAALCLIRPSSQWKLVFCDAELSSQSAGCLKGLTLLGVNPIGAKLRV
jgi:CheY-like chemotaxis protein